MRKPRDIDAELKALTERAARLKARKLAQLGELTAATGADALDAEVLAGLLLHGVAAEPAAKAAWRVRGEAFFRGPAGGGAAAGAAAERPAPAARGGPDAPG